MLFPNSFSEQIMFSTIRIQTDEKIGTGFLMDFDIEGKKIPIIITNKHVLSYDPKKVTNFFVHTGDIQSKHIDDKSQKITFSTTWFFHPKHDICFCFAEHVISQVYQKLGKTMIYCAIPDQLIPSQEQLEQLSGIENVYMVGYPKGLWDAKNNLPLYRNGITSSHPAIDFNEDGIGVVDMACFKGSSGSPIFIIDENGFRNKNGSLNVGRRKMFLGVLFQGPTDKVKAEYLEEELADKEPELYAKTVINLGYYVKAKDLLVFKDEIRKHLPPGIK